jgi:hypothetical protein
MTKDEVLKLALKKAFLLGQNYQSLGDSEYSSHWKKADVVKAGFDQLVKDTVKEVFAQPDDLDVWKVRALQAEAVLEKFMAQPEQEPVAWRNAAIRLGEELSSVGPDNYYDMDAGKWLDWAMEQEPRGKSSLASQRTWVGLTEAQCGVLWKTNMTPFEYYQAIEAKLKEKNT